MASSSSFVFLSSLQISKAFVERMIQKKLQVDTNLTTSVFGRKASSTFVISVSYSWNNAVFATVSNTRVPQVEDHKILVPRR